MDINDFETLGECPFGTVWLVRSENKIVVNAYQAALYFSIIDFFHFANMVNVSAQNLANMLQEETKPKGVSNENKEIKPPEIIEFKRIKKKGENDGS